LSNGNIGHGFSLDESEVNDAGDGSILRSSDLEDIGHGVNLNMNEELDSIGHGLSLDNVRV